MQPLGFALSVVFALPDPHARFHRVDDVAAGGESRIAMLGAGAHPDGEFAQCKFTHAVHACRVQDFKSYTRLLDDLRALGFREFRIGLIGEPANRAAFVAIAHAAFERDDRANAGVSQLARQRVGIDRRFAKREDFHQPPETGGKNAISSPSASARFHGANSPFTATRRCSGAKANPLRAATSRYSACGSRASLTTCSESRPAASRSEAKYSNV